MLVWFIYDISKNKNRNKLIKLAQEYGLYRVQKSVFLGDVEMNLLDEITLQSEEIIIIKEGAIMNNKMQINAIYRRNNCISR